MAALSFCDEKTLQKNPHCDSITRSSSELILRTHYYYQIKRNSWKEKTLRITQTHAETHLILKTLTSASLVSSRKNLKTFHKNRITDEEFGRIIKRSVTVPPLQPPDP
jgi:hypothetical protein